MTTHVVILGAGFGGLELASRLDEKLAERVRVTLIDQSDSFVFGFSKLEVMFGRQSLEQVRIHYRDIAKPNVDFRQERVVSIDPTARRVITDHASYDADILVVALGADLDPGATPGLLEGGYEFYSPAGAERVREVLPTFDAGVAVISVLGPFFKCPPAPYEAAFLLHDYLLQKGVRQAATVFLLSSLGSPIPISAETSAAIVAMLAEKEIEFWPSSVVGRLDPSARVAHLTDGRQLPYDLFLGIPVHRAPRVAVESGLTDDGWIAVDPATFATRFPDVYAVGDITSAPVPRAGIIAEGEARTVAEVLVARLTGGAPPAPFAGEAICYIEAPRAWGGSTSTSSPEWPPPPGSARRRRRWPKRSASSAPPVGSDGSARRPMAASPPLPIHRPEPPEAWAPRGRQEPGRRGSAPVG